MNVETRQNAAGIEIVEYERPDFTENVWEYNPGDRVTFLGPSGSGKTWFAGQLLKATSAPDLTGVMLVLKPRDDTATKFSKDLGYPIIKTWPPAHNPWKSRKPAGWTLWPAHDFNVRDGLERTRYNQWKVLRTCMADVYAKAHKRGRGQIIFADELAEICEHLALEDWVKNLYSRGRSNLSGIWGATQRPVEIPQLAYSSADHVFLAHDPDERDRKRFSEFGGGIDPKLVDQVVLRLPQYWWLYLRRIDRTMCIVRA